MTLEQDPLIGVKVRDYVLVRLLGRGAMGMVYLARHSQTNKEVAIKFLSGEYSARKEFVSRFVNEAAACGALNHENIIHVFEAGEEEGTHFMVMEYLEGVNLAEFLRVQDRVKETMLIPWIRQVASGLQHAHAHGIVHRDLKPDNLMLTRQNVVKIADLGLSKNLEEKENSSMTMSGTVIGTPYYISPEQARDAKRVDIRTDIYSLGATFYHLATGSPPFQGNSAAEVMARHMNEMVTSPQRKNPALSDGFSDLLVKMLEKEPSNRFQDMNEVIEALNRLEAGDKVIDQKIRLKKHYTEEERSRNEVRVLPYLIGVGVFLLILALGAILFMNKAGPIHTTVLRPPPKPHLVPQQPVASNVSAVKPPDVVPVVVSPPPPPVVKDPAVAATNAVAASAKPGDDEEMVFRPDAAKLSNHLDPHSYNWVDLFGVIPLFLGIPAVQKVGLAKGVLRAVLVWVAVVMTFTFFGGVAEWLQPNTAMPMEMAYGMAYVILSAILILFAWVATHGMRTGERETWVHRFNDKLAILPGLILGAALAVWFVTLLGILGSPTFPIRESWIGNQVVSSFSSVDKATTVVPDKPR